MVVVMMMVMVMMMFPVGLKCVCFSWTCLLSTKLMTSLHPAANDAVVSDLLQGNDAAAAAAANVDSPTDNATLFCACLCAAQMLLWCVFLYWIVAFVAAGLLDTHNHHHAQFLGSSARLTSTPN
jgi:hypothetical protein